MDSTVDALTDAYHDFISTAAGVLETNDLSGGHKNAATDAALEEFKQRWELFMVSCDQAEDMVESMKQRIGLECLVDEATVTAPARHGRSTIPPISAVRLEQMSKAVRLLAIELRRGSAAHSHSSAPFDARFSEDTAL